MGVIDPAALAMHSGRCGKVVPQSLRTGLADVELSADRADRGNPLGRELLGEILLEMNDPAQALEQFEATLKKEPGRLRSLYGAAHSAQLSGSRETAQKYFRELLRVCGHADKPGRSEVAEAERAILEN